MDIKDYKRNQNNLQLENEEWRNIPKVPNDYYISNLGRVKSTKNNQEKIMIIVLDRLGYAKVHFSINGKNKGYLVHRLVAFAFISNPNNYNEINHKDGDKQNNCVDNLEWCTHSQNMKHAFDTGLKANKKGEEYPYARAVYQYDKNGNFIKRWGALMDAARAYNIHHSCIAACCSGKVKTCLDYAWSYYPTTVNPESLKWNNGKAVYQYDKNGNFIKKWHDSHEAAREALGNENLFSIICKCCRGERLSAGGYIWTRELKEIDLNQYKKPKPGSKIVAMYDMDGNFLKQWGSTHDAERETGIDFRTISKIALGNQKSYQQKFVFKYIKN